MTGGAVAVGGRTAHPGPAGAWTVLAARAPGLRFLALMPALLALPLAPAEAGGAADARRSGFEHMSPATQALQRDDSLNPAWLWVVDGQRLWTQPAGATGPACASCHGDAAVSMRAVAARYPAFDERSGRPVNLSGRIDACRVRHQQAAAAGAEDKALLGLQAYVALQSRGLPMAPPADARLQRWREQGRALFTQRLGQLDLSCAMCHDRHAGQRLGGSTIPQGHPTGYPLYRLEWQALGSLQRRLRNCLAGVRAQVPAFGDESLIALELHLAERAAGLPLDAPAVRP